MNKAFEKILERLEEPQFNIGCGACPIKEKCDEVQEAIDDEMTDLCAETMRVIAKEIVKEVAEEYNNGWIPCSERLPEDNGVYFVTLDDDIMPRCIDVRNFRNGVFEQRFIVSPLQGKCPEEKVVAWMPLPEPYKEND